MPLPTWIHPPKGVHWTPRLLAALALVAIAGGIAFAGVLNVLSALLVFGGDIDPASALQGSLQKHEQLAKLDRDRFDGRSAFFMPTPPVRALPKPPPPKIEKPVEPPPPSIPAEYTGKRPIAVLGPIVYFDSFQIKTGEESNGIKVIATNAPWSVKLGHEGGEYDVAIWPTKKEEFFNGKWSTARTAGIESTAPVTGSKQKNPGLDSTGKGNAPGSKNPGNTNRNGANGAAAPPPGTPPGSTSDSPPSAVPGAAPANQPQPDPGVGPATPPADTPAVPEPIPPVHPPVPAQPSVADSAASNSPSTAQ
ncbi:MAG: hypothetical protein K8R92_05745 [Planctomycetes bacterium]|nr:hypothetical protein [Planctomycetota bacterium]